MKCLLFVAFIAIVALAGIESVSLNGYKLLNLFPASEEQLNLIKKFQENSDFDIWNNVKGIHSKVVVLLSPSAYLTYKQLFELYNIKFTVVDENIQNKIDEQERSNLIARQRNSNGIVNTYAAFDDIQSFIKDLVNPSQGIRTKTIGVTSENRNLNVITFKKGTPEKKVWIDCGIHGREKAAVSFCVYLIDYLNRNQNDQDVKDLLSYYEIIILPVANPDGYEYARTTNPVWRKNRKQNTGTTCFGVDLNRNFAYRWMETGASSDPCTDVFAGQSAESESETKAIRDFVNKHADDYDAFITVHTYGLYWFTSWSFTAAELPSDYADLKAKADIGAAAAKASLPNGSTFSTGSSAKLTYPVAGTSDDWAKSVGIKYTTTLELRPGVTGTDSEYGFFLPADRLESVGIETTAGVLAYLKAIKAQK